MGLGRYVGLLGGSCEGSGGTRNRLWAVLRPLGYVSEGILSHLPLSWTILEAILGSRRPSWSYLGPSWALSSWGRLGPHCSESGQRAMSWVAPPQCLRPCLLSRSHVPEEVCLWCLGVPVTGWVQRQSCRTELGRVLRALWGGGRPPPPPTVQTRAKLRH